MNEYAQKLYDKLYKKTELEKIYEELFAKTTEQEYLMFGVAYGIRIIYELLNEYKKKNIQLTNSELIEVINLCANEQVKVKEYYNRLIKDIK